VAKTAPPAASVEKTMSFMPGQVQSHSYARTAHWCRTARRAAHSGLSGWARPRCVTVSLPLGMRTAWPGWLG
jgi:hypothetical protein